MLITIFKTILVLHALPIDGSSAQTPPQGRYKAHFEGDLEWSMPIDKTLLELIHRGQCDLDSFKPGSMSTRDFWHKHRQWPVILLDQTEGWEAKQWSKAVFLSKFGDESTSIQSGVRTGVTGQTLITNSYNP